MLTGKNVNRALCTIFLVATLCAVALTRLDVDFQSFLPVAIPALFMGVIAAYCSVRQMPKMSNVAESLVHILGALYLGLVLSYAAASSGAPMMDATLFSVDQRLGFDWWRYIRFFNAHPDFALVMHIIYLTMFPQILLVGIFFATLPNRALGERFISALMLALMLTVAISVFTPAAGIYALLHVDLAQFPHLSPTMRFQAVEPLAQLRSGTFQQFRLSDSTGIISFPSFHSAAGALLIWAAMHFNRWKWPVIAINVAMIASTPVEGAHYLVDVFAGIGVAVLALLIATRLHWQPTHRLPSDGRSASFLHFWSRAPVMLK